MKDFEFYQNLELKFPEFAICIEDSKDGVAKFFIPILTPTLDKNIPYDKKELNVNTRNIVNDVSSMNIEACTYSNYLSLKLPHQDKSCKKGDKFVVIFIGGDPNKPYLLGRYYDAID